MSKYYKKTKWFNIYTRYILPIFMVINIFLVSSSYSQIDYSNTDATSILIAFILDIIYLGLLIKTTIDIFDERTHAVKLLIVMLIYNLLYKSFWAALNTSIDLEDVGFGFIVALPIYSIYYIPNIIYFYHRIDYFNQIKKVNIVQNDESQKQLENTDKKSFCTNCGKETDSNWKFCKHCGNKF